METINDSKYLKRQKILNDRMLENNIDLIFCPPSADLEYLTGTKRRKPTFGNISYRHGWVCGAFFRVNSDPIFILPRMVAEFDMPYGAKGEKIIVNETDDSHLIFENVIKRFGKCSRIAVEERTWAETVLNLKKITNAEIISSSTLVNMMRRIKDSQEIEMIQKACDIADYAMEKITENVSDGISERELSEELDHLLHHKGSRGVSFDTAVWAMGKKTNRDADDRETNSIIPYGSSLLFDFGAIINGYCSDFGRTLAIGKADSELQEVYEIVIKAAQAGLKAVKPGVLASDVDKATRKIIDDAGYGDKFRHRTGHCIGLDVHEYPFISEEDDTPLEEGMTFTIEPSIFWPGNVGARIEDIILVTESGGKKLNQYSENFITIDNVSNSITSSNMGCNHVH